MGNVRSEVVAAETSTSSPKSDDNLQAHICVIGKSGAGKTCVLRGSFVLKRDDDVAKPCTELVICHFPFTLMPAASSL